MDLSYADRVRLRAIVRKTHRQIMSNGLEPDNHMCDELIDALGPEVAGRMVKAAVDGGHID